MPPHPLVAGPGLDADQAPVDEGLQQDLGPHVQRRVGLAGVGVGLRDEQVGIPEQPDVGLEGDTLLERVGLAEHVEDGPVRVGDGPGAGDLAAVDAVLLDLGDPRGRQEGLVAGILARRGLAGTGIAGRGPGADGHGGVGARLPDDGEGEAVDRAARDARRVDGDAPGREVVVLEDGRHAGRAGLLVERRLPRHAEGRARHEDAMERLALPARVDGGADLLVVLVQAAGGGGVVHRAIGQVGDDVVDDGPRDGIAGGGGHGLDTLLMLDNNYI